ncbi:hypothetical protein TWF718_009933 [Orbilia javanica]|uniref:NACHT domain-containing protein n=1 Tax=Orbilia javanica TaxID=47235 RepID=A0AAN8RG79_9PEZI
MSGAEFIAVAGVASSIIAIIDGMAKVVEAALDAEGLPKAFRRASQKLPMISDILDATKTTLELNDSSKIDTAAKRTVDRCQEDWDKLKQLFDKVVPEDKSSRMERYKKAARTLGKGGKVETLMKNLLENVQLLATFKIMTERGEEPIGSETDKKKLDKHIADVAGWEPSLPDDVFEEKGGYTMNVSGSGNSVVQGEGSRQNNFEGHAQYFEVKGDYNASNKMTDKDIENDCLKFLHCPDPHAIKNQLKASKDRLVRGSMNWILADPNFINWKSGKDVSLLWIKGGAGKGKTMTTIGLIEELSSTQNEIVAYSFCRDTDYELNTVESVVKGLMHCLLTRRKEAMKVLLRYWDEKRNCFKEDITSWKALWNILLDMLSHLECERVYLIIDALDECGSRSRNQDLVAPRQSQDPMAEFLRLLVRTGLDNPSKAKWLVTSRPLDSAERELLSGSNQALVTLELNYQHVAIGIATYITERLVELDRQKSYGPTLRRKLKKQITQKAGDIYMWASLVCKELELVDRDEALATIEDSPPGLDPFYERALKQISAGESKVAKGCIRLVKAIALAFRPIHLEEVESISGLDLSDERLTVEILLDRCTSFLRARRDGYIELVHQSSRDYLNSEDAQVILDSNGPYGHREIVINLVSYLSRNLKINIGNRSMFQYVRWPFPTEYLERIRYGLVGENPLWIKIHYPVAFWVHHLGKLGPEEIKPGSIPANYAFGEDGPFACFLQSKLLQWLECVYFFADTSALDISRKLGTIYERHGGSPESSDTPFYVKFIHDAGSFLAAYGDNMKGLPLLVYAYVQTFAPECSTLRGKNLEKAPTRLGSYPLLSHSSPLTPVPGRSRKRHREQEPDYKGRKPFVFRPSWSPTLRDLHKVIRFSPNGKYILSRSCEDKAATSLWDAATGEVRIIRGHLHPVKALIFSPGGEQFASGSENIKIWDTESGELRRVFQDGSRADLYIRTMSFSPDGNKIASVSDYGTLDIWDVETGALTKTIEAHRSIAIPAFSPDGRYIVTGSYDGLVKFWAFTTGNLLGKYDTQDTITALEISPDGKRVALGCHDSEVYVVSTPFLVRNLVNVHISNLFNRFAVRRYRSIPQQTINHLKFHGQDLITNAGLVSPEATPKAGGLLTVNYIAHEGFRHLRASRNRLYYGPEGIFFSVLQEIGRIGGTSNVYRYILSYDVSGNQVAIKFQDGSVMRLGLDQEKLKIPLRELLNIVD